jgi:hypothetical protein
MADIFISYRRADAGWAGRLAKELQEKYDVFFDTETIEKGENFPNRIAEALNTFKIFLSIIGPEWVKNKAIKRLSDPHDWVRKEIAFGMERARDHYMHFIPVLVHGAKLPEAAKLPEELRPLADIQSFNLSHENWSNSLRPLLESLDRWMSCQAYAVSARNPLPPVIPHLCNRIEQEDSLCAFFTNCREISKTPVIILHGHKWEEHYGFIDRLLYRRFLEDILCVSSEDTGFLRLPLDWNVELAVRREYDKVLLYAIRRKMGSKMASREEIQNYFRGIRQPHLFLFQIVWAEFQRCGEYLLEGLIQSWQNLFQIDKEHRMDPAYTVVLWINMSYDKVNQVIALERLLSEKTSLISHVLPVMSAIEEGHIKRWIEFNEVKYHVAGKQPSILSLVEDKCLCPKEDKCLYFNKKGKLHMRCFVEGVKDILAQTIVR